MVNKLDWRSFVLALLFLLVTVPAALANLDIEGVRVYVDGSREPDADDQGGKIDSEVYPGSEIRVRVDLRNDFDRDSDIQIENINVELFVKDIDLGADIFTEIDEFDIDAGKGRTVSLTFQVPQEVEPGPYEMNLHIEGDGDDVDRTQFEEDIDFEINVIKKDHDVRITEARLTAANAHCGQEVFVVTGIQNFGISQESVRLQVQQFGLGVNYESAVTLDHDIDAADNTYQRSYPIRIPVDASGTFPIDVKIKYAFRFDDEKRLDLIVTCPTEVATPVTTDGSSQQTSTQAPSEPPAPATPTQSTEVVPVVTSGSAVPEPISENAQPVRNDPLVVASSQDEPQTNWILIALGANLLILTIGIIILYLVYSRPKQPKTQVYVPHRPAHQEHVPQRPKPEQDQKPQNEGPKPPQKFSYY